MLKSKGKWYLNFSVELGGSNGIEDFDENHEAKIPLKATSFKNAVSEGTAIFTEMTINRLGEFLNDDDINWWEYIKLIKPFISFETEIGDEENILASLI